ncbi:MAG: hypothetical protein HOA75_10715 [Deltaproteobacteria bacterium]|nr:hypothetical protein [Deltaproteobacteria bacterium]
MFCWQPKWTGEWLAPNIATPPRNWLNDWWGYAFRVEFVELGLGDPPETAEFNGVPNEHGLHGNAILSR